MSHPRRGDGPGETTRRDGDGQRGQRSLEELAWTMQDAGRLEADNGTILFNYGKSYLDRIGDSKPAIAIYEPELPLNAGVLPLPEGLLMPGCIRDASPDAWGRRVIINKKLGLKGAGTDTAELDELTYLIESGSDRIGALDFQRSPAEYVPRTANNVSMEELIESAERVEKGVPLTPEQRSEWHLNGRSRVAGDGPLGERGG